MRISNPNFLLITSSIILIISVILETFIEPIKLQGSVKMYIFDADQTNYKTTILAQLVLTEEQLDVTASIEESGVDGLFHVNYQIPIKNTLPFSIDTDDITTNNSTNNVVVNNLPQSNWYRLSLRQGNRIFLHKSLDDYELESTSNTNNILFNINGFWYTVKPSIYL